MQTLTYTIGTDKRALVKDVQNFQIDFKGSKYNWVQARQFESAMRQVFVNMKNEDGSPFDLTGCNIWFEGVLPDKTHKVLDAKHGIILDPTAGQFRFDMPKQAFAMAGSYVQAFFRIMKDGDSVTTLEFDLEVLADKVISGLIPADYSTPFEDLYDQLADVLKNANSDLQVELQKWVDKFQDAFNSWNGDYVKMQTTITAINTSLSSLETKIDDDDLITKSALDTALTKILEKIQLNDGEQYLNPVNLDLVTLKAGTSTSYEVTENMQKYIDAHIGGALEFPNGDFDFNETINLKAPFSLSFSPNTRLIVTDDFVGDTLFSYKGTSINDRFTSIMGNGATILGNNKIGEAFVFQTMSTVQIKDLWIKDCLKTMIAASGVGYGLVVNNVFGANLLPKPEGTDLSATTGIYSEWTDNNFTDCTFVNFSNGFYIIAAANDLTRCHVWNVDNYVPVSSGFVFAQNGWGRLSYCTADTCAVAFKINNRSYLDHCRVMGNPGYESLFSKDPIGIQFTDATKLVDVSVTSCVFENNYSELVLQILSDAIEVNSETFSHFKSDSNSYIGHVYNKLPEIVEAISTSVFYPKLYGSTTAGSPKYDSRIGQYKRIGNMVFVNIELQVELDETISGNYLIGGLPFPNGSANSCLSVGWRSSTAGKQLLTGLNDVTCNLNPGKDYCELLYSLPDSEIQKNVSTENLRTDYFMINLTGHYFID